jgi:hypothetical protein
VRYAKEDAVLEAIFNLSPGSRTVPLAGAGSWTLALSTDASEFGGPGEAALSGREVRLPGHTAVLLRRGAA